MRSNTTFGGCSESGQPCDDLVRALLAGTLTNGSGDPTRTLVVLGAPCSGKTQFAYRALLEGIRVFGDTRAVMTVSGRVAADALGNEAIRVLGAVSQARPVTTMSALAFRAITAVRSAEGEALPRLLNGAEQDALLRLVVAEHIQHARSGDECSTCALLREYFAQDSWADMVCDPASQQGARAGANLSGVSGRGAASESTSLAMFTKGISDAFIIQLRDIISRINELGLRESDEQPLIGRLHTIAGATGTSGAGMGPQAKRLDVQWRLAFALRQEYAAAIERNYPGQYRLDPSMLLVEGALAVPSLSREDLPELIVVDDAQDLTLAGLAFLEQATGAGARLLIVNDPDESVQAFRGSHPEYALGRLLSAEGVFHAAVGALDKPEQGGYRNLVVSRVSLDIASEEQLDMPIPERPWKNAVVPGSYPIASINTETSDGSITDHTQDGSVGTRLYASANEELEAVVAAIKAEHLDYGRVWNDMAVIAHDNATVRAFGERLRRDGVPVRYSSVTTPLKDEPFVQGLFALIELAQVRLRGASAVNDARFVGAPDTGAAGRDNISRLAAFIRSRVRMVMGSPLITARRKSGKSPARIEPVELAMQSLVSLSTVIRQQTAGKTDQTSDTGNVMGAVHVEGVGNAGGVGADSATQPRDEAPLRFLEQHWSALRDALVQAGEQDSQASPEATSNEATKPSALTLDAIYLLLTCPQAAHDAGTPEGEENEDASVQVLGALSSISRHDADIRAFGNLWRIVGEIASGIIRLDDTKPVYVLSLAWERCHVATAWQTAALVNSQEGRAANDRLDVAMRLFDYASGAGAGGDITTFFRKVRSMRIEADSLAKVAPIDQAVTLTTPAGSGGRHWPLVWIVAMQQDVWPNLMPRNTMFGGEDLDDLVLHGTLPSLDHGAHRDERLTAVLHNEQKGLLVALTRASEHVTLTAVRSDDLIPSDFLLRYLPERFDGSDVGGSVAGETAGGDVADGQGAGMAAGGETAVAQSGTDMPVLDTQLDAMCTDVRGLVAAARITLARNTGDTETERHARKDAYKTLTMLKDHGVLSADPRNWSFLTAVPTVPESNGEHTEPAADVQISVRQQGEQAGQGEQHNPNEVKLSPSSVDGLWACPVCWMMDNQFAGPRPGGVQASIGTIVHQIAQEASQDWHLDAPDNQQGETEDQRIAAISDQMMARYQELRVDPATVSDPADRYTLLYKDAQVSTMLGNIASYFVKSNDPEYVIRRGGKDTEPIEVGKLESAECEKEFNAKFTLSDIAEAYNRVKRVTVPATAAEIGAIMGAFVGGWPEGMSDDLTIRLSGRIDREEHRSVNGNQVIRLIDYKTGNKPDVKGIFNDLQLVCYQLGLAYPSEGARLGETSQPLVAQSELFHVSAHATPAESYAPETLYQPPLFVDGHLNDHEFSDRYHYRNPEKFYDYPRNGEPPVEVREELWKNFTEISAGTQIAWALAMIARVFYAGAALRSERIVAHPQKAHLAYCDGNGICPACAGEINTVFETRKV